MLINTGGGRAFGIAYDDGEIIAALGKLGAQERVIADMSAYGDNAFALCKGLLKVLDALDGDTLSELGLIAAAVEEKLKPVFCKKALSLPGEAVALCLGHAAVECEFQIMMNAAPRPGQQPAEQITGRIPQCHGAVIAKTVCNKGRQLNAGNAETCNKTCAC